MNESYRILCDEIDRRRRRLVRDVLLRRMLRLLAWCCALLAIVQVAFALTGLTVLPLLWDLAVAATVAACAAVLVDILMVRPYGRLQTAREMERQAGRPHQLLSLALELRAVEGAGSEELAALTVRLAAGQARSCAGAIGGIVRRADAGRALAATALLAVCLTALSPRVSSYWSLPGSFLRRVAARIEPGSLAVARLSPVTLRLVPQSGRFPSCRLRIEPADGTPGRTMLLRPDSTGAFSLVCDSLVRSFTYEFTLGAGRFGPESVTVVPPPFIYSLRLNVDPPAYTRLAKRELAEGQGNLTAYAGSTIGVSLAANYALDSAVLVLAGDDPVAMTVDGEKASCAMVLARSGGFGFRLTDRLGQHNDTLPSFYLEVIPDEAPQVRFLKPGENRALAAAQSETLWVEGIDDLGIAAMRVRWLAPGADTVATVPLPLPRGDRTVVRSAMAWDLAGLGLYPGDTVFYWAVAADNRPGRPDAAVSDTFWFRMPGFEEIHRQVARQNDYTEQTLEQVQQRQEALRERIADMVRPNNAGRRELTWEEKQIVDDVRKQLEAQKDSLQKAVESLRETVEQLNKEGFSSDEIMNKMEEVRKAVEELVKQYGDSLLFDTMQEKDRISYNEMQKAVENLRQALPGLEKKLDAVLKYLEMLKKEQEREAFAQRLERLAQQQQEIADAPQDGRREGLQKNLMDQASQLRREMEQRMKPGSQEQLYDRQDLPSLDRFDSLAARMDDAMRQDGMPPQETMHAFGESMLSMADQMRSMSSDAMAQRMEQERQRLLGMAHEVLTIGDWRSGRESAPRLPDSPDAVREQQALSEALRKSMDRLDSLRMLPPSRLQQLMEQAAGALGAMDGALSGAAGENGETDGPTGASAALNGLAQSLLQAAGGMQGQGGQCQLPGGGGLSGMMRKLSGRQAAINSATSDLLRMMLSGKSGQGMQEGGDGPAAADARRQARAAQQALADQLRQLADEYGAAEGGGTGKKLKNLEDEARRLAAMLDRPDQGLRDRQDRFLVRMLQSSLSIHRQDEGKQERKSSAAAVVFTDKSGPSAASRRDEEDAYHLLRQKAFEGNYPPQYRMAVRSYFDSLGVLFLREGLE